jgi:hypothetical protein
MQLYMPETETRLRLRERPLPPTRAHATHGIITPSCRHSILPFRCLLPPASCFLLFAFSLLYTLSYADFHSLPHARTRTHAHAHRHHNIISVASVRNTALSVIYVILIHTCIYMPTYTHICMYMYIYIYIYTYIYICVYMYMYMFFQMPSTNGYEQEQWVSAAHVASTHHI